jgi:hypothetical protein
MKTSTYITSSNLPIKNAPIPFQIHSSIFRYVVPYNPWLLRKYNAYINLEACMNVKSIKYIFKYIYKGHDSANIEVQSTATLNHDEITTYLDTRYVSPPEAIWRLSEYHMHSQSHSIVRLPVHLPRQQPVYFQPGQELPALSHSTETLLTAWFHLNSTNNAATQYLYADIPNHFDFDRSNKQWKPRKRGGKQIIARMYSTNPKDTERFALRTLLLHIAGAKSYEDLRTVDGVLVPTFNAACKLHNLLTDDTQWEHTLAEAVTFQMPHQLRLLFAVICSHCDPLNPQQLWHQFKDSMIEDYARSHNNHTAENMAQLHINNVLAQSGKQFTLPTQVTRQ